MKSKRLLRLLAISVLFLNLGFMGANSEIVAAETADTERCTSITFKEGAAILDVSTDDLQTTSHDIMVSPDDLQKKIYKTPPYNCTIRSKSDFLKSIAYITYIYSDPKQAHSDYIKMKKGYESVSTVEDIPGLGDKTFWVADNRFQRLVGAKGTVLVDILSPKDVNLQKQVIRLVLDNLSDGSSNLTPTK